MIPKNPVVAVVGATGVVGQEMIEILERRKFPLSKLVPLASARSVGKSVTCLGHTVPVQELSETSFEGVDIALFSAGGSVSAQFVPIAVASGAVAIDNTSHFRMHPDVPLIVPEVNGDLLKLSPKIIANPNCSTAQLVVILDPLHQRWGIKRVVVSTYQSVSGAGKAAMDELENQARFSLQGKPYPPKKFPHPIAFNIIPQIDQFTDSGYTKEELKMINETRKILRCPDLPITATTVRVGVFVGHSESVNIELNADFNIDDIRSVLANAPGVDVVDDPDTHTYPTPRDAAGKDAVFVGRIRRDLSVPYGIDLWNAADNLRKGAALNAIQIAEGLMAQ